MARCERSWAGAHGECNPRETVSATDVPAPTAVPSMGVCDVTTPSGSFDAESTGVVWAVSPNCSSAARASPNGRPTRYGTSIVAGPALITKATLLGRISAVPATGDVVITSPRGRGLSCSATLPTSSPTFSSASCAASRSIPTTLGTLIRRWPALTSMTTRVPLAAEVSGPGVSVSTVDFGEPTLNRDSPCCARNPAAVSRVAASSNVSPSTLGTRACSGWPPTGNTTRRTNTYATANPPAATAKYGATRRAADSSPNRNPRQPGGVAPQTRRLLHGAAARSAAGRHRAPPRAPRPRAAARAQSQ